MRATGIFFSASLLVLLDAFVIPQQPSVARRTQTVARQLSAAAVDLYLEDVRADAKSCSTILLDDAYSMSPDPSRPIEAFLELDQEACALWYLRDQIASNARVERRSLLLGVMACCRLGDENAAGALWQHMASLYGGDMDWRRWSQKQQTARGRMERAEEAAAVAELAALHYDHAQVFDIYSSLLDQRGHLPASRLVYKSLAYAFTKLGSERFGDGILREMAARRL